MIMRNKKKNVYSFARRIIKVWLLGIVIPLIFVESLILWQFYHLNKKEVENAISGSLESASAEITDLMNNMSSISWLLQADSTVGKNISLYFAEENLEKKADFLIYIQEQIANYEVANPSIANLTYLYIPYGKQEVVKINQSSLFTGKLPDEADYLCKWQDMTFYGPHETESRAAKYPCISLVRPYLQQQRLGDIYIYVESGFKYLQKLYPQDIMNMGVVFSLESAYGRTVYSSDEEIVPLYGKTQTYIQKNTEESGKYKVFCQENESGWKLYALVPTQHYYRRISTMVLSLGIVTLLVVTVCILASIMQWYSLYKPFTDFEKKLQLIASDSDVETRVEQMNIQEFDDSFAILESMKRNILHLLNRVQEEEKKRSDLEIKVVIGKINPHFLYNTLDTLKWYAAGKSDKEMVHFITALNKLLLYNMSKTTKTTLQSELDAVKAYIILQELKYDIDFHVDMGKHPEILQADMPRFILQPLVENAILHSGTVQGRVWMEVELLTNGKIDILIKNEGNPIDPNQIKQVLIQKKDVSTNGIGLQYVARMLESRFGEDFELKAEHTEEGINVVEIRFPFEAEEIGRQQDEFKGGISRA